MLTISQIRQRLIQSCYVPTDEIVAAVWQLYNRGKNILIEGKPGSGKSYLGYAVADIVDGPLYYVEWPNQTYETLFFRDSEDFRRRLAEASGPNGQITQEIFYQTVNQTGCGAMLDAFACDRDCVVLLDEFDKSPDDRLDLRSLLLRILFEFQTTVLGNLTLQPKHKIHFIATSNQRIEFRKEMLDRFVWVLAVMPTREKQLEILRQKFAESDASDGLLEDVINLVEFLGRKDLWVPPTLRGAQDLVDTARMMNTQRITDEVLTNCIPLLVKREPDYRYFLDELKKKIVPFLELEQRNNPIRRSPVGAKIAA